MSSLQNQESESETWELWIAVTLYYSAWFLCKNSFDLHGDHLQIVMSQHINGHFLIKIPSDIGNLSLVRAIRRVLTQREVLVFGASLEKFIFWDVTVSAPGTVLFWLSLSLQRSCSCNNNGGKQHTKKFTWCFHFRKLPCLFSSLGLESHHEIKNMQVRILLKHASADAVHGQRPWTIVHGFITLCGLLLKKSAIVHELQASSRSRVPQNHSLYGRGG